MLHVWEQMGILMIHLGVCFCKCARWFWHTLIRKRGFAKLDFVVSHWSTGLFFPFPSRSLLLSPSPLAAGCIPCWEWPCQHQAISNKRGSGIREHEWRPCQRQRDGRQRSSKLDRRIEDSTCKDLELNSNKPLLRPAIPTLWSLAVSEGWGGEQERKKTGRWKNKDQLQLKDFTSKIEIWTWTMDPNKLNSRPQEYAPSHASFGLS